MKISLISQARCGRKLDRLNGGNLTGRVTFIENNDGGRVDLPTGTLLVRTSPASRKSHQIEILVKRKRLAGRFTDAGVNAVRLEPKPSRSRYEPHVGHKQIARAERYDRYFDKATGDEIFP